MVRAPACHAGGREFESRRFRWKCSLICIYNKNWNRSSVWLERLPVTQEVASSSLVGSAGKASKLLLAFLFAAFSWQTIKYFYNSTDEYSHSDLAKIPESLRDSPIQDFYLPKASSPFGRFLIFLNIRCFENIRCLRLNNP